MVCTPPKSSIGSYIRAMRRAAGLTLRQVAKGIGVTEVYLGEVERDVRTTLAFDKMVALERVIPGFSSDEARRHGIAPDRPIQLTFRDAPPQYKELGLMLARRLQRQDFKERELETLWSLLAGDKRDGEPER